MGSASPIYDALPGQCTAASHIRQKKARPASAPQGPWRASYGARDNI